MEAKANGSAAAWRERIGAQRDSGQSIRAWCRDHKCHEHAFYWWRARLGLSPARQRKGFAAKARPVRFAEVVVNRSTDETMSLRLAGGRELALPASMPVQQVAALIRALETTP